MKISLNLLRKLINEEIRVCLTEESNAVKQLKSEKAKKELEIADIAQKIADETSKEAERTAARAKASAVTEGGLEEFWPTVARGAGAYAAGRLSDRLLDEDDDEYGSDLEETIKKVGDEWAVYPKAGGRRLGTHDTESGAKKQLAAIEMSKKRRG
jgi:hypothetical protein